MKFLKTFTPMSIGKMTVKNRLVVPAMDSVLTEENGEIRKPAVDYYAARARGGFGMVIVEVSAVNKRGIGLPAEIDISSDAFLPGLTKLADGIKENGARAIIQLTHSGRMTMEELAGGQPVAPAAVPCPFCREKPHQLTTEEVYELIEDYVNAAVRAKTAGFDGVEIHGGHGYLVEQFLSPRTNKRIDEFGGNIESCCLFPKLIVEGIKKMCGPDYPVLIRLGTTEGRFDGIDLNRAIVHAQLMENYGYDAIDVSAGTSVEMGVIIPPPDVPVGWNIDATKRIKSSVTIPVIAVGRYNDPAVIEHAVLRGDTDFVALGRQSIADPSFPNKMFAEKVEEIVPCISCTQRCLEYEDPSLLPEGDICAVSCMLNPMSTGRPEFKIEPAKIVKKVVVVGAGPAGLEAAWIAASRGHEVVLLEKNERSAAGGQFLIAAYPPFKQDLTRPIKHYLHMCEKYGVDLRFGVTADSAEILSLKPDVLIVATGAEPIRPEIMGINTANIKTANEVLLGEPVGGKVLVIGGGLVGVETAEYCTEYCEEVVLVEMSAQIASELPWTVRDSLINRFKTNGIAVHTNTKVLKLDNNCVMCECDGETLNLSEYSTVILAVGSKANNPFADMHHLAAEIHVIGDAKKARNAVHAIYEAAQVAVSI